MAGPYEVAIDISLRGTASAGLGAISKQLSQIEEAGKRVKKQFDAIGAVMAGSIMQTWGEKTVSGLQKMVTAGADFVQVQKQMEIAGFKHLEVQQAVAKAHELSLKYGNLSDLEVLKSIQSGKPIFGTGQLAIEHSDVFARVESFQKAWEGAHPEGGHLDVFKEAQAAVKSAEIAGQTSPAAMDAYIEKFLNARIATCGNVSSQQLLQAQRLAGPAYMGWNDDFRHGVFPAMVQEYGPKAGTMAMTSFSKLGASNFWSKQNLAEGENLGLIDPTRVQNDSTGRPMRLMPGGNLYGDDFVKNPLDSYMTHIKPMLDKLYGDDFTARASSLTRLGGNANIARELVELDLQHTKLEKDRLLPSQVMGDKSAITGSDNYFKALGDLQAQFQNFVKELGVPSLGNATDLLHKLAEGLKYMTSVASAHPEAVKNLAAMAAGLGGAMAIIGGAVVFAGTVALLGPGSAGMIAITALTGAMAGLAAVNWSAITEHIKPASKSIAEAFADWQKQLAGFNIGAVLKSDLMDTIKAMEDSVGYIGGRITAGWKAISDAFINGWNNFISHIPFAGGLKINPAAAGPPGGPEQHSSLSMPPRQLAVNIPVTVQMDGRRMASTVMNQVVASATYPTSASGMDTRGTWAGPSYSPTEMG